MKASTGSPTRPSTGPPPRPSPSMRFSVYVSRTSASHDTARAHGAATVEVRRHVVRAEPAAVQPGALSSVDRFRLGTYTLGLPAFFRASEPS